MELLKEVALDVSFALDKIESDAQRERLNERLKRSEEDARWLAQENAIMAEIGRIIGSTLNIGEIYESFAEAVRKLIAFDRIVINTINIEKSIVLLRSRKPYAYTDDDVRLAEKVGSQIAGAIANAQLYTERLQSEKERAALEEQLHQAQKMEAVGRLAGGVAHDFNNMLGVIIGHAELALGLLNPGEPLYLDLQEIRKAALRSADLTRQLLAFARRQTVCPEVLDLNDTVSGMLKMLGRLIGEDIDLAWMPGRDLWKVRIDPSQVDQILANMAVNARDAIAGVGKITIETGNVVLDDAYCAGHAEFVPGEFVLLAVKVREVLEE